jgi:hypothetical protein
MGIPDIKPNVYLINGTEAELAIHRIVDQFTLNAEQERAFRIISDHSSERVQSANNC